MPDIFKALATIIAWTLFISSWVMGLSLLYMGLITGTLYGGQPWPMIIPVSAVVTLAFGLGSVVVMRLRQKME